jgi:hypothetical protein
MSPLSSIKKAGFTVSLETVDSANALYIAPYNRLTAEQLAFLKANKQAIINDLLMTTVHTPNGQALTVLARDAEHKAFLLRMNPQRKEHCTPPFV